MLARRALTLAPTTPTVAPTTDRRRSGGDPACAVVLEPHHHDLCGRRAAFWRHFRGVVLHSVVAVA